MAIVRVRKGIQATTFDHANQTFVTLVPGAEFDSNDPFVKENAWAFTTDAADEEDGRHAGRVTSVSVEEATATPGAKRNR